MSEGIRPKSFIRIYWCIWFVLVLLLLTARFSIFNSSSEDELFKLFTIYAVPTWVAVMILNLYEGHRLIGYLKQHHRSTWEYITYVPFLGLGGVNSFRSLPFLYSKDDLGDEVVAELKKNYRRFAILMLVVFFTLPVLFFAVMLL
jgi:hypothetical protein